MCRSSSTATASAQACCNVKRCCSLARCLVQVAVCSLLPLAFCLLGDTAEFYIAPIMAHVSQAIPKMRPRFAGGAAVTGSIKCIVGGGGLAQLHEQLAHAPHLGNAVECVLTAACQQWGQVGCCAVTMPLPLPSATLLSCLCSDICCVGQRGPGPVGQHCSHQCWRSCAVCWRLHWGSHVCAGAIGHLHMFEQVRLATYICLCRCDWPLTYVCAGAIGHLHMQPASIWLTLQVLLYVQLGRLRKPCTAAEGVCMCVSLFTLPCSVLLQLS
jgi:hypothetical protein